MARGGWRMILAAGALAAAALTAGTGAAKAGFQHVYDPGVVNGQQQHVNDHITGRWRRLVTTVYLLTSDFQQAWIWVQATLVKVHARWRRIRRDDINAYVPRALINNRRGLDLRKKSVVDWRRRGISITGGETGGQLDFADRNRSLARAVNRSSER